MKKKLTIASLCFIGAAILWFIGLIAAQLFFDGNIFDKGLDSFIWRFLIILLIVGISGLLLITSVSIYEYNKNLAYVSGAMTLLTALFALFFFIIGKYETGFLSYATLTLVIISLCVNQITDMQYRAKQSIKGLKITASIVCCTISLILVLSVFSLMNGFWESTAFVFFFVVLCLAFIGLKIAVGAIAKSINKQEVRHLQTNSSAVSHAAEGKETNEETNAQPQQIGEALYGEQTVRIPRAEYEELLKIKAEYEKMRK